MLTAFNAGDFVGRLVGLLSGRKLEWKPLLIVCVVRFLFCGVVRRGFSFFFFGRGDCLFELF